MFRRCLGLALLMTLVACDDQVQVESPNSFHTDVRAIATQARGAGDILLTVAGADTVGSPEPVMNAVRDARGGREASIPCAMRGLARGVPGSVNPSYTLDI